MRIINQSVVILSTQSYEDMLKICTLAGRTCYKSKRNESIEQDEKFIRNIIRSGHESVLEHISIPVKLITSRTVTHQLVRHRLASFSQESQRYCNYSKDKFDNEITIIKPYTKTQDGNTVIVNACKRAEEEYFKAIELGETPELARAILPNATKTEIVITANIREWRHILELRIKENVQPETKDLMRILLEEFKNKYKVFFENIN